MQPTDCYQFYLSEKGLCIDFPTRDQKSEVVDKCQGQGIDFVEDIGENMCLLKSYDESSKQGAFVSQQGYFGIAFETPEKRYYFKTLLGITNEQIFESAVGQESSLFFNIESSELIVNSRLETQLQTYARPSQM